MLKRILVPLTGQDADRDALRAAFAIGRDFDAHVDGLFVRMDPRDAIPLVGEGMSGALADEAIRSAEAESAARARQAGANFDDARIAAGAVIADRPPGPGGVSASWLEATGRTDELILREGRLSDLVVFAHEILQADAGFLPVLESALLGSARPLLLAPASVPPRIGGTVAIAWNGGVEATRAVAAAMPVLRRADSVHVLTAEPVPPEDDGNRLAGYLAWHGIAARVTRMHPRHESVGASLMSKAAELGADLLVMGGYGHSRVREMILGGVTRYVLKHSDLPIMMAH